MMIDDVCEGRIPYVFMSNYGFQLRIPLKLLEGGGSSSFQEKHTES